MFLWFFGGKSSHWSAFQKKIEKIENLSKKSNFQKRKFPKKEINYSPPHMDSMK